MQSILATYTSSRRLDRERALRLTYAVLFAISCFALLYRLSAVPAFFTDEGLFLNTADTFVNERVYVIRTLYADYAVTLSVGAPVIVPLSYVLQVFGVGLVQARAVVALFSLLALFFAARLATALFGRWAGPLAWWLLFAHLWPFYLLFARAILGETPALALTLAAWLCWYRFLERRRWHDLVIAGIGLGLAMATKPHMLLLIPTFGLVALLDLFYYRLLGFRHFLAMGLLAAIALLLCYAYQIVNVGWAVYARDTASMGASSGNVFNIDLSLFWQRTGFGFNERSLKFALIMAALVWHGRHLRPKTIASLKLAVPVIFCLLWVTWHTLLATNTRYAFIGYAVGIILVSGLLAEGVPRLWISVSSFTRVIAVAVAATLLVLPIPLIAQFLQHEPPGGMAQMAGYVRTQLPATARIETLDWGIEVFARRRIGHMPLETHYALLEALNYPDAERRLDAVPYDFRPNQPDYLMIGPASRIVPAYMRAVERGEAELIVRFEEYALYRVLPLN